DDCLISGQASTNLFCFSARRRKHLRNTLLPARQRENGNYASLPNCQSITKKVGVRPAHEETVSTYRMQAASPSLVDSRYAVMRLMVTLALMTIGASGMYVMSVVLPTVQSEFGVARAD